MRSLIYIFFRELCATVSEDVEVNTEISYLGVFLVRLSEKKMIQLS